METFPTFTLGRLDRLECICSCLLGNNALWLPTLPGKLAMGEAKALLRMGKCSDSSELLLLAHAIKINVDYMSMSTKCTKCGNYFDFNRIFGPHTRRETISTQNSIATINQL